MAAAASAASGAAEVRQAILDGVGRIFDISPECFDQQAPSAFGIFRWSIEKAKESPGVKLDSIIADLPERQEDKRRVLQFLVEYHDKKKLYRKQVDLLLCSLLQSPSWRSAGIDTGCGELTAKLQERIHSGGQAAALAALSTQASLAVPPGPPSTGGSTDAIAPERLNRGGDGEVGGVWEIGKALPEVEALVSQASSPTSSRTKDEQQFRQDEVSMDRFEAVEDQVRYLTGTSAQMRQELNTVKRSVDTLKTTVLAKIEIAIQEILECHDSHAKEHDAIKDRLEHVEHRFQESTDESIQVGAARDDKGDTLALVARIDCIEAAMGDNHASQSKELGTMLSQLESLAKSARDPMQGFEAYEALSNKVAVLTSDLQRDSIKDKALRDAEFVALDLRLDTSMQKSLAGERRARESFQKEMHQWLEGVEKKVSERDQAAKDFKQRLLARRNSPDADVLDDLADRELGASADGGYLQRSPVPLGLRAGPPRQTPPHSPDPPPPRDVDQPHPVAAGMCSPEAEWRQMRPPVASVARTACIDRNSLPVANRVQFSPPPGAGRSPLSSASVGNLAGAFSVPFGNPTSVSSLQCSGTVTPMGDSSSLPRSGQSPPPMRGSTRAPLGTVGSAWQHSVAALGQQDARCPRRGGSYHVSPGGSAAGSYHVSPGGSGTYPVSKGAVSGACMKMFAIPTT